MKKANWGCLAQGRVLERFYLPEELPSWLGPLQEKNWDDIP
jgi:hypothetical protein